MQPQMMATRCDDSESGEVRAALDAGVPCDALTGGPIPPAFFEKLSAFFQQGSFSLEFLFLDALKLGLILHWQQGSAPQPFAALRRSLGNDHRLKPGNANLPIGGLHDAIQENGVPGRHHRDISLERKARARTAPTRQSSDI